MKTEKRHASFPANLVSSVKIKLILSCRISHWFRVQELVGSVIRAFDFDKQNLERPDALLFCSVRKLYEVFNSVRVKRS